VVVEGRMEEPVVEDISMAVIRDFGRGMPRVVSHKMPPLYQVQSAANGAFE
jgi:hypothetical protein